MRELKAIEQYIKTNAAKFKVHEYKFLCGSIHSFGGRNVDVEQRKIRLPHGAAFYVESAQEASKHPQKASKLLSKVIQHVQKWAEIIDDYDHDEYYAREKPGKRNSATHDLYVAVGEFVQIGLGGDAVKQIRSSITQSVRESYRSSKTMEFKNR